MSNPIGCNNTWYHKVKNMTETELDFEEYYLKENEKDYQKSNNKDETRESYLRCLKKEISKRKKELSKNSS